jgi:gamma-glutamyltranspeptidase / glutathione hydrolase
VRRPPAVAARWMVATSQPAATLAGLRALERGGNAADAAIAAAAVLCVAEPMMTGIGSDLFALVWRDGVAEGLDAAGPAAAGATPEVELRGPGSVTVPGAVAGWAALAERGRLGLDACLSDAIDLARRGFAAGRHCDRMWRAAAVQPLGPAPGRGRIVRMPELATTLEAIAERGPDAIYRGEIAARMAAACALEESDLAAMQARPAAPLRISYRGTEVLELPPPTQGVAALEALALLEPTEATPADQVQAVRLALEDAYAEVRDGADVRHLLAPEHLARRAAHAASATAAVPGDTVYLCAVDEDRMAVSLIQSLFEAFGSGVLVPGTGIVLHNRGAGFAVSGAVEPGRRPFHTLIAAMLARDGALVGPFGVMGGAMQTQGHVQLVSALVDGGLDPQAALDRPRFRVDGDVLLLEEGLGDLGVPGLRSVHEHDVGRFGAGQAILLEGDALIGGSDSRRDGFAGGL